MKRFRLREFVFDCSTYELTREGEQIPLPRLPTKLLLLLLERSGQLLTQQALVSELWPHIDAADATPNLHAAIKRIRMALGDSPADPAYIQTVIGMGYRFIAPTEVETFDFPSAPAAGEAELAETPEQVRFEIITADSGSHAPASLLTPAPLKTPISLGPQSDATSPSFATSAAAARPLGQAKWLLWAAVALLVTVSLTWAAHALWRSRSDSATFAFAPIVRLTANNTDNSVTAQAISPDGQKLVFAAADGLMIQGLHDPAPTPLALPALQNITYLSWFPDGKRLAVSGLSEKDETPQVWIALVDGSSPPVLFRDRVPVAVVSLVTNRIAFLSSDGTEVWDAAADGSGPRRLLAAEGGTSFNQITWMADKPFLIAQEVRRFSEQELEDNPNRLPRPADSTLLVVRAQDGAVTARESGYQLIEGCAFQGGSVILGAGDEKRPVTLSATLDPESAAPLKKTPLPPLLPEEYHLQSCSVPSTGDVALALQTGKEAVFVGELTGNDRTLLHAHPITSGKLTSFQHAWSADGQSVLYEQWHGKWFLFQQQVDLHEPQPLRTPQIEGVGARRSPDGRWILFFRPDASGVYKLFHMPTDEKNGTPTELPIPPGDLRCPSSGTDCVYRVQDAKAHLAGLYALNPESGALHLWHALPWNETSFMDWDVSPDGASVVLCGPTTSTGILRFFDLRRQTERVENFPVNAPFRAINWNSDGKGWFGAIYTENGSNLYYLGTDHSVSLLRHSNFDTWANPSPDGRKLAFVELNQDQNVWLTHQSSAQ